MSNEQNQPPTFDQLVLLQTDAQMKIAKSIEAMAENQLHLNDKLERLSISLDKLTNILEAHVLNQIH